MKIYKSRNPNKIKMGALFLMQVIFGTLPAVLFLIFAINNYNYVNTITDPAAKGTSYIWAYISAAAIVLCGIAYFILARRYNVILSGLRGEKSLAKVAKRHKGEYDIFLNCPVQYKRNRSEIDMIMLGKNGIIIVEAKNHSGIICGSDSDETWVQYKHYRDGKNTECEMKNPIKQITRQREILKSILRANGTDVWIDGVVYFSNPMIRLKLGLKNRNSIVCAGERELEQFIREYKPTKTIKKDDLEKIRDILRSLM